MIEKLSFEALSLLKKLISTPSFSKEENNTADLIQLFIECHEINPIRQLNNVWAIHPDYQPGRPTLLLNSHHDTVKPTSSWTFNPFNPTESDSKLIGLGSNDAGAPLVSLLATFLYFAKKPKLKWNLIFSATAEEENSGANGIESILDKLPPIDLAIVGEPTKMELAIAEKGLIVLDCTVTGKPGHAAREEGQNAIYRALPDIQWFQEYRFPKISDKLGTVKMTVTQINAGYQHNMVPDICTFVVDIRTNELYSNSEALKIILDHVDCEVKARSLRLNSSSIDSNHPIVRIAEEMKIKCYGSPTGSDQAVMPWPSVKIGPGDSARSHTADEFVYPEEITEGIKLYIRILEQLEF